MSDFNPMDLFRLAVPDSGAVLAGSIASAIVGKGATETTAAKTAIQERRQAMASQLMKDFGFDADHPRVQELLTPDAKSEDVLDAVASKQASIMSSRMIGGGLF